MPVDKVQRHSVMSNRSVRSVESVTRSTNPKRMASTGSRMMVHNSTFMSSEMFMSSDESHLDTFKRRFKRAASDLADNKFFVSFGILLTIWALCGDDIRLLATHRTADSTFDGLVVFCITFFTLEALISCIGKDDYFMSFFFGLDMISLVTLFLDLTVVSEAVFDAGSEGESETDKARSSKTARAGARIGRVVRVLRLFRIVKLFKAAHIARKRKPKVPKPVAAGEELLWDSDDDEEQDDETESRESLVGKKLSARTTQRTILLVLIMLIVIPLLSTDSTTLTPAAAEYGADEVMQSFMRMRSGAGVRSAYENTLLKYLYYHNWFLGYLGCPRADAGCSFLWYSQVFWIGITGKTSALRDFADSARMSPDVVKAWNDMAALQDDMYNFGVMPDAVVDSLGKPWDTECELLGSKVIGKSLIEQSLNGMVDTPITCPTELRITEYEIVQPRLLTPDDFEEVRFTFVFDLRHYTREEASINIIKTAFVCVVLCTASLLFSRDANFLVLQPVEQMITKVEAIRDDPLAAMKMADDDFTKEENKRLKLQRLDNTTLRHCARKLCSRSQPEMLETVILEKTIIKLGSLLALGFGEAGTNIVSSNMRGAATSGVNAMIEGSRVDCIVGNARISNFGTATEVLQGKVMTFVNQVAEIVHGIVDQFSGAVNKNSGETFLVIWRTTGAQGDEVAKLAEMSVVALARILAAVHCSPVLAAYRSHPGLQQRLRGSNRVHLTFGLHRGWAIEGAVGSEFKIDASYLSPNVSLAASLEQASGIYDVSILVSDVVVGLCGPELASQLRLVDKVILPGSKAPLELYVLDLDPSPLKVDKARKELPWNNQQRCIARKLLESSKRAKWSSSASLHEEFHTMHEIRTMRRRFTYEFFQVFSMGYRNYSEGEWQVARTLLMKTQSMLGSQDGPSTALLKFMEASSFDAPSDWQGVRKLEAVSGERCEGR